LTRQAIVFTNSRIGCGKLASALERSGIKAGAIHGDKSQIERMQILESFKKGTMDVLVATDVAARGLDIADMPCVINHELPFNAEDYVHRIGRTGRAGAQGDAIALVDASEERLLADIEKLMNRKLLRLPLPDPANGPAGDPFFYMPYQASTAKDEKPSLAGQAETTAQAGAQTSPSATASHPFSLVQSQELLYWVALKNKLRLNLQSNHIKFTSGFFCNAQQRFLTTV
jgi:ATP-dependent RNA helicase RhlE